jgi:hypothetical protein
VTDRLIETGKCRGMEMDVGGKTAKAMTVSKKPSTEQNIIDKKQVKNVEFFNYLGSMMINVAKCTREIKSRIAHDKIIFQHE